MSLPGIQVGAGITFGEGIYVGGGSPPPPPNAVVTYTEMPGPVSAGYQLQDSSATVNNPIGFTINNSAATGVAVLNPTGANLTYYNTLTVGQYVTASFGAGSTHATAQLQVSAIPSGDGAFGFFIDNTIGYPATFNYPFNIS